MEQQEQIMSCVELTCCADQYSCSEQKQEKGSQLAFCWDPSHPPSKLVSDKHLLVHRSAPFQNTARLEQYDL